MFWGLRGENGRNMTEGIIGITSQPMGGGTGSVATTLQGDTQHARSMILLVLQRACPRRLVRLCSSQVFSRCFWSLHVGPGRANER